MSVAVVFAYHDVGVRCLKTLLARGVEVALVVTHENRPGEDIWFDSVRRVAEDYRIPVIAPEDPNTEAVLERVRAARPDFLFSFYYRSMLGAALLAVPTRGAYNMHGSLLPKYRGRVPVNWAVIEGETETGATLHVMNEKPDNGAIVDQFAVPILPDDTAREVFDKVRVAAELVLWRSLPALLDGSARPVPQELSRGRYYGGRRPEDGRIPAGIGARRLHDLVRALARPYPGTFADLPAGRLVLWRTLPEGSLARPPADAGAPAPATVELHLVDDALAVICADGGKLRVLEATLNGAPLDARSFRAAFGCASIPLAR
ncbi:MAG: formyltransferase [Burkholderiaceae bacterium]|nr:formyltransferase [Burkholderiaceae bacterium]